MRSDTMVYLMYHELEIEGRPLCQGGQGYARYVVSESHFGEQMNWLQSEGIRGLSVSQALDRKAEHGIAITFDDGCETDLTVAAPLLRKLNYEATFYITLEFLGRPGFMVPKQVRELSDAGFDIGCHSMTHAYLSDLKHSELDREIVEAKVRLQEIIGRPVHHFSCPGGRWSPLVAEIARAAGYQSVATSRIATNNSKTDHFRLSRIAVTRSATLSAFQDISRGRDLWLPQLRTFVQTTAHQLLGNSVYDRLRGSILERKS